mgnify:CR=1 FL=1
MAFAHLHVHTEYSLLDGSNKIKEYVPDLKHMNSSTKYIGGDSYLMQEFLTCYSNAVY